ncbi:DUF1801 domain-containing protein [Salaquimonas pukyongi]|uniref:DUF1801 domain-containing protein n=1 Tax=Salaquimonas pukyongi TaxID=2712698 RepID=UPI00096BB5F9|nr:DUF1801 domain-containing protein [Salaquimonas pukyongi]
MTELFETHLAPIDPKRQAMLRRLRQLVLDTASKTHGAGEIVECLKWGQPSFVTENPKSGSTIRIDAVRGRPDAVAMYFICTSGLVERFREQYPDRFDYEGNRALIFKTGDELPEEELSHCIAMALTHKLRNKQRT